MEEALKQDRSCHHKPMDYRSSGFPCARLCCSTAAPCQWLIPWYPREQDQTGFSKTSTKPEPRDTTKGPSSPPTGYLHSSLLFQTPRNRTAKWICTSSELCVWSQAQVMPSPGAHPDPSYLQEVPAHDELCQLECSALSSSCFPTSPASL